MLANFVPKSIVTSAQLQIKVVKQIRCAILCQAMGQDTFKHHTCLAFEEKGSDLKHFTTQITTMIDTVDLSPNRLRRPKDRWW